MTGGDNIHYVLHMIQELTALLNIRGYELRKLASNSQEALMHILIEYQITDLVLTDQTDQNQNLGQLKH